MCAFGMTLEWLRRARLTSHLRYDATTFTQTCVGRILAYQSTLAQPQNMLRPLCSPRIMRDHDNRFSFRVALLEEIDDV